jgi:hypothetical protein
LFDNVKAQNRGTAQGLFSLLTALGNTAPVLIGALAGGALGSFSLEKILIWIVSGSYVVTGILFMILAIREDKKIMKAI